MRYPAMLSVSLPAGTSARFPQICVGCGATDSSKLEVLSLNRAPLNADAMALMADPSLTLDVPVCRRCRPRVARARNAWRYVGLYLLTPAMVAGLVIMLFRGVDRVTMRVYGLACGLGALIVTTLVRVIARAPFDFELAGDSVRFDFASDRVGKQFAAANPLDTGASAPGGPATPPS